MGPNVLRVSKTLKSGSTRSHLFLVTAGESGMQLQLRCRGARLTFNESRSPFIVESLKCHIWRSDAVNSPRHHCLASGLVVFSEVQHLSRSHEVVVSLRMRSSNGKSHAGTIFHAGGGRETCSQQIVAYRRVTHQI